MFRKAKTKIIIFIIMFSILSWFSPAIGSEQIRVGYIEFPPVFSTGREGLPEGILIDLGRRVLKQAGLTGIFKSYPTKRMSRYLAAGEIHLWMGLSTLPEFNETAYIGESTLFSIELRAYTITGAPPIKTKDDLNGKSILTMRGYSYGGWVDYIEDPVNKITTHKLDTHISAFQALSRGKFDYLLDYRMPSDEALKQIELDNLTFNTISSFDAKFVVSKKAPDAKKLLKKLEATFQELSGRQ